jgi:hypothetical protein
LTRRRGDAEKFKKREEKERKIKTQKDLTVPFRFVLLSCFLFFSIFSASPEYQAKPG